MYLLDALPSVSTHRKRINFFTISHSLKVGAPPMKRGCPADPVLRMRVGGRHTEFLEQKAFLQDVEAFIS